MRRPVLKKLCWVGAFLGATLAAFPTIGQEFPKKQPIKVVVPFNAGGLTDILARVSAEYLQRRLGQAVVVENRPGASGAIAADFVAKAPADGYTLFVAPAELALVPALRNNLPYKFDEFTYLIRGFVGQPLIMVGPNVPVSSIPELVAFMKANPGKYKYGTPGIGSATHLSTAALESAVGVKGVHVPYTGIAPVYQDLLAGTIDFTTGGSAPVVEGIKVIGTVASKRSTVFPDLPSLEEAGIKSATWNSWIAFVAPPNLPKPIADRLIAELGAVYKDPEAIAKFLSAGKIAPEANPLTGESFKKQVIQEYNNWKVVAEREKIVVQQ